jgi:hypothetical protein
MIKGKQADFELGGANTGEHALRLVNRALKWLWEDNTKKTYEEAVYSLTWEEIVGTLMEARVKIMELEEEVAGYERMFNEDYGGLE